MKKTILVSGLHGYIGSRFGVLPDRFFSIQGFKGNILDKNTISQNLEDKKIDAVLHLAAKAHIDKCEKDKKLGTKGETWAVNVEGTKNIIEGCRRKNIKIFYLSTECVFDGKKGNYKETDKTNSINWYGETKRMAENLIIASGLKYCILRSVFVYGHPKFYPNDIVKLFYKKFSQNGNVTAVKDQYISFTYIDDLIKTINLLIRKDALGIYHYCGEKEYTPYYLAETIRNFFNFTHIAINPVTLNQYFGKNGKFRLKHASLDCTKIKSDFSVPFSSFEDNLSRL